MSLQPRTQWCSRQIESEYQSRWTHRNSGSNRKWEEFVDARNPTDPVELNWKDRDRWKGYLKTESLGTEVEHQHHFTGPLSVLGDCSWEHRPQLQSQWRSYSRSTHPQWNLAHLQRQIRFEHHDRRGRW